MSAIFVYFILPAILLILGLPIFLALFVTSIVVIFVTDLPTGTIQIYMFGSLDNFPLLAVPFSCWRAKSWRREASLDG